MLETGSVSSTMTALVGDAVVLGELPAGPVRGVAADRRPREGDVQRDEGHTDGVEGVADGILVREGFLAPAAQELGQQVD